MKALLDANILIWMLTDRKRLTPRVLRILEDDGNDLFASMASLWELSAKTAAGRLPLPGNSIRSLLDQLAEMRIEVVPITDAHILRTETLPYHHADPFDRMLMAQAL